MTTSSQCKTDVAQYFEKENRPFSVADVLVILKAHGKTAITRAIDELVSESLLSEKTYGKQKVFVADQSKLPEYDGNELKALEAEITELTRQLSDEKQTLKTVEAELKKVSSTLTLEEAQRELGLTESELIKVEAEVLQLRSRTVTISTADLDEASSSHERFVTEWRKRKRMAMEVIDTVAEGYPKSKKQLIEDVGIETDEDCGVILPNRCT